MLMTNFLKDRESIRDFKRTKISQDNIKKIKDEFKNLQKGYEEDLFSFEFYEDGKRIQNGLDGKAGYNGVMINSPHYISLSIDSDDEMAIMYGPYNLEKLTSFLHTLDIATCWITLTDVSTEDKYQVLRDKEGKIQYLLAIGYAKPRNPFEKESFSDRKSIQELVFQEEVGKEVDLDDLENRGLLDLFYYVRYAPSTKNLQPWRFLLVDSKVVLLLDENNLNLADAGIIMYYFEALANIIGIRSTWEETDQASVNGYKKIVEFKL